MELLNLLYFWIFFSLFAWAKSWSSSIFHKSVVKCLYLFSPIILYFMRVTKSLALLIRFHCGYLVSLCLFGIFAGSRFCFDSCECKKRLYCARIHVLSVAIKKILWFSSRWMKCPKWDYKRVLNWIMPIKSCWNGFLRKAVILDVCLFACKKVPKHIKSVHKNDFFLLFLTQSLHRPSETMLRIGNTNRPDEISNCFYDFK